MADSFGRFMSEHPSTDASQSTTPDCADELQRTKIKAHQTRKLPKPARLQHQQPTQNPPQTTKSHTQPTYSTTSSSATKNPALTAAGTSPCSQSRGMTRNPQWQTSSKP